MGIAPSGTYSLRDVASSISAAKAISQDSEGQSRDSEKTPVDLREQNAKTTFVQKYVQKNARSKLLMDQPEFDQRR